MADERISALTTLGTQSASDYFVVVEASSGTTKKEARSGVVSGIVSDTAYGVTWNGVVDVAPSKNAVYDLSLLLYPLDGSRTITGPINATDGESITNTAGAEDTAVYVSDGYARLEYTNTGTNFDAFVQVTVDGVGILGSVNDFYAYLKTTNLGSHQTFEFPATGGTLAKTANKLSDFAATTSAELAGVISDETGSGALVFANTPTLVTPLLGTPTSGVLTNCTGLPFAGLTALTDGNILVGNGSNVAASVSMSGEATIINTGAITLANSAVIGKVLTGYTSGAGTVAGTDTILQAIQKLNGNIEAGKTVVQKFSYSSAQILAFNGTPQTLYAATGTGKIYEILDVIGSLTFVSAAYTTNLTMQVFYQSGSINILYNNATLLQSTVSRINHFTRQAPTGTAPMQYISNGEIRLNVAAGNPAAGDGTLDIYVIYREITL